MYQTCLGKYQRELSQLYHGHILATANMYVHAINSRFGPITLPARYRDEHIRHTHLHRIVSAHFDIVLSQRLCMYTECMHFESVGGTIGPLRD